MLYSPKHKVEIMTIFWPLISAISITITIQYNIKVLDLDEKRPSTLKGIFLVKIFKWHVFLDYNVLWRYDNAKDNIGDISHNLRLQEFA